MTRRGRARLTALTAAVVAMLAASAAPPATDATWTETALTVVGAQAAAEFPGAPPAPPAPPSAAEAPFDPSPDLALDQVDWSFPETNLSGYCVTLTVSSQATEPQTWRMGLDLSGAPFWGAPASTLWGTEVRIAADPDTEGRAVVTGEGARATLAPGESFTTTICTGRAAVPPPGDRGLYTTTVTPTGSWTDTQGCLLLTVTATVDPQVYPYFFGWTADIDMRALREALHLSGANGLSHVSWSPGGGGGYAYTVVPSDAAGVPDSFTLTSGTTAALRGGQSLGITVCAYGW